MDNEIISEKIEITTDLVGELKAELRRTGLGPQAILRGTRNSRPKGLNTTKVKRWLNGVAVPEYADKEVLEYVLKLWASFPDRKAVWMVLTQRNRKLLQKKLQETGLTYSKLFLQQNDLPKGFQPNHISAYFTPSKETIKKEYYDYILKVCEANKGKGYVPLTANIQQQLQTEIDRTRITPTALVRKVKKQKTIKVNTHTVTGWLRGNVKTIDSRLFDEVMALYAEYPDKVIMNPLPAPSLKTDALEPIQGVDLHKMQQYRDVLGILPSRVFNGASDVPEGLNTAMVSRWLNGVTLNADPIHVKWVLGRCREITEIAVAIEKL